MFNNNSSKYGWKSAYLSQGSQLLRKYHDSLDASRLPWTSGFVLWNVETVTGGESVTISWKESHPPSSFSNMATALKMISYFSHRKVKGRGQFPEKKMKSNCKWVYLKWKRQHFHSKCILLKMQTCQACKLSIWIDQTQLQIWYFPYLSSKGIVYWRVCQLCK